MSDGLPPNPNDREDRYRNSCMNRVIHGMRAAGVIPGEDYGELEELNFNLKSFHQPHGPDEEYWFHKIVMLWWRMRRMSHIEVQIFTSTSGTGPDCDILLDKRLHLFQRYETNTDREMQRAIRELDRIQKLRGFNRHTQAFEDGAQPQSQPAPAPEPELSPADQAIQELAFRRLKQFLPTEFFSQAYPTPKPSVPEQGSPVGNPLHPDADKAA